MTVRRALIVCAGAVALALPTSASADTAGTRAYLRSTTVTLITAELKDDGATICGKLNAGPLTATIDGQTCAQRWDARAARLLAARGAVARLHADLRSVPSALITMHGE